MEAVEPLRLEGGERSRRGGTDWLARPIAAEAFVWAAGSAANLARVAFDPELLRSEFPGPHSVATLVRALDALGLAVVAKRLAPTRLPEAKLPCIVLLRASADDGSQLQPAIVAAERAERVVSFRPGAPAPSTSTPAEFAEHFAGFALEFQPKAEALRDEDGRREAEREFGFRWFVPELLRHKRVWRDVLVASLILQLAALATPLLTQVVIDKVVVHHTTNTLIAIGIALAVFMVFGAILGWVRQYLVLHTGNRVDAVLGAAVFEHLFRLPPRYFEHRPTGVIVARLQAVETIREFLASAAVTLLLDCPFLVVFVAIMFYYSVTLTGVVLAILATMVVLSLAVAPIFRARLNHQFLLGARNQAFVTEHVAGLETVKGLQMEPQLRGRYGRYLGAYLHAGFETRNLANTYNTLANGLEQLMTLLILCLGAWVVMTSPEFTIGMLVAFQMFAMRLSQPMLRLVGLWQQFQQAGIAVQRLGDVMNAPAEPYSVHPTRTASGAGAIEIAGLGFRYSETTPFLYRHLNLAIPAGAAVGIIGPSGCGKSTLAKLLQGFYVPTEGAIRIDGLDVRHLSANELRRNFGVVFQETVLFSGTVYDNLLAANPQASFEEIVTACRAAEIHEVIEKLPQGYQTELGERGVGLSGGQRQRIAIARALLKRPRILLFDEATSGLDTPTAEAFARTVNSLRGHATVLFIAHQMPRALQLDSIVRLGPEPAVLSNVASAEAEGDHDARHRP
ncbi:MAG: peptidase domain-containing ABC transporter [Burkholderiales bacterium]